MQLATGSERTAVNLAGGRVEQPGLAGDLDRHSGRGLDDAVADVGDDRELERGADGAQAREFAPGSERDRAAAAEQAADLRAQPPRRVARALLPDGEDGPAGEPRQLHGKRRWLGVVAQVADPGIAGDVRGHASVGEIEHDQLALGVVLRLEAGDRRARRRAAGARDQQARDERGVVVHRQCAASARSRICATRSTKSAA